MIPAAFDYVRAESAEQAIALVGEHGDDAKFIAGGHSLIPLMRFRLAAAGDARSTSVGSRRPVLHQRRRRPHRHRRHDEASWTLENSAIVLAAEHVPLLAHAVAAQVGDPQVRHRGTLGGSLAHGDPASDLPAATARPWRATYVDDQGSER